MLNPTGRRTATVVALERTETLAFQYEVLDRLRRTCPAADRFLLETMATAIRRTSATLLDALYVPSDQRVLRRLADLEDQYRGPGPTTEIPLTQEEVATLAGASRATVNQVLRGAQADGYVRLRRRRIAILDRVALRRRAGS